MSQPMSRPAMDAGAFAEMKELMGDAFNDIISMCIQSLPEQLAEIKTAIKQQDAEAIFNISHKMKSSCGSIGAFGLAEKAEVLEVISRDGSADISAEIYDDLHGATQQVLLTLNTELTNNYTAP